MEIILTLFVTILNLFSLAVSLFFTVVLPALLILVVLGLLGVGTFNSLLLPVVGFVAVVLGIALVAIIIAAIVVIVVLAIKKKKAKAALVAEEVDLEEIPEEAAAEVEVSAEATVEE